MKSVVENQNIVVLKADMTEDNLAIENKLVEFGNTAKAIPYYAVYRPGEEPHHFDGNFLAGGAKSFLETAGIVVDEPLEGQLASEPFSAAALEQNLANGNPVLVCFTADWDVASAINQKAALNKRLTKAAIDDHRIVVLKADMTEDAPEVYEALSQLGNEACSIPYYAIYRPDEAPHAFDGSFAVSGARGFLQRAGLLPELPEAIKNVSGDETQTQQGDVHGSNDGELDGDALVVPAG